MVKFDASVFLGSWPYRDVAGTRAGLLRMLRVEGVEGALVSPLAGLFHTDPEPANARLLRDLTRYPHLWAAPVINARLAGAAAAAARLADNPQVRAVRLAPGFHSYSADEAVEVVRAAAKCGLAVAVQLRMQDERSHPPTARVPPVPIAEALALVDAVPEARVVIAGARLGEMAEAGRRGLRPNVWLDLSHLDGLECVGRAREAVGATRLLFATGWPFFYAASARLKVAEAELGAQEAARVLAGNAAEAFAR